MIDGWSYSMVSWRASLIGNRVDDGRVILFAVQFEAPDSLYSDQQVENGKRRRDDQYKFSQDHYVLIQTCGLVRNFGYFRNRVARSAAVEDLGFVASLGVEAVCHNGTDVLVPHRLPARHGSS